jgi:hypothetical protein
MKQEQFNFKTLHIGRQQHMGALIDLKLPSLKDLFFDSCHVLGNVLLLIGGDDTVEIGFKSQSIQLMAPPSRQLTSTDNKA